eukprot:1735020-Pleurochrysis_carterae.AAC.2
MGPPSVLALRLKLPGALWYRCGGGCVGDPCIYNMSSGTSTHELSVARWYCSLAPKPLTKSLLFNLRCVRVDEFRSISSTVNCLPTLRNRSLMQAKHTNTDRSMQQCDNDEGKEQFVLKAVNTKLCTGIDLWAGLNLRLDGPSHKDAKAHKSFRRFLKVCQALAQSVRRSGEGGSRSKQCRCEWEGAAVHSSVRAAHPDFSSTSKHLLGMAAARTSSAEAGLVVSSAMPPPPSPCEGSGGILVSLPRPAGFRAYLANVTDDAF